MIQNRRTCPWYLNDLREKCALALGFLAFCRGASAEAVSWYDQAAQFDQKTIAHGQKGGWSNVKRLKWGVAHGYLYAYPAELALFQKDKRLAFAVLAGDFFYCTERFPQARAMAERLLAGEFGELNARQKDYAYFLQASAVYWEDGHKRRKGRHPAFAEHTAGSGRLLSPGAEISCQGRR